MLTGDQGVMLESGEITIGGRYKDIIIRGGENIAPTQIEAVLNCREHIKVISSLCNILHFEARADFDTGTSRWCIGRDFS